MEGELIIISGPSASGKTVIVRSLLAKVKDSTRLVTVTTRDPRPGEVDGRDYFFIKRDEFLKRVKEGDFFEHAEVYGNLCGSSKTVIESSLKKYSKVFAVVDIKGAKSLKQKVSRSTTIFIKPGSLDDILRRLKSERRTTPQNELDVRMKAVAEECALADSFDHVVTNVEGKLDQTVSDILKIIGC